jgi:amino-acid N-acetyltransferase
MIRRAEADDLAAVLGLLAATGLPAAGVADHFGSFFVADEGGRIVASAGVELHGETALLRSLAVAADARGAGLGAAMLRRALAEAHERASVLYALTTTAASYLARLASSGLRAIPSLPTSWPPASSRMHARAPRS